MSENVPGQQDGRARTAGLNRIWGELIVEELVRSRVCAFCVSPGSRSTPLVLAVAENARALSRVHFDERGAAYYALGCAKASGAPAVLICTSGTAAANYLPAVVEASQSGIPLIVLTADRPPELLDAGANQAIDQTKLYGDYVRWQFTLPCPDENVSPAFVLSSVDQAVYRATGAPAGPVHLNCMFREPFVHQEAAQDFGAYLTPVATWRKAGGVHTRYAGPELRTCMRTQAGIVEMVRAARRGLLVVGELRTPEEIKAVKSLAFALKWPAFPDVSSGLRLGNNRTPFVPYYDQVLLALQEGPDTVFQIGAPCVSKRLLERLGSSAPERYILVDNQPIRRDPLHGVTLRVQTDIEGFCGGIAARLTPVRKSEWLDNLHKCNELADKEIDAFLSSDGSLSEPWVARHISLHAPEDSVVFLGNSMPIRDMDMFGSPRGASVRVTVNRGASGIEGNIAAAAGYASAVGGPVTALLGDLSALHDLNSLALLREGPLPLVLVVLNNDGGGIFSFLPVASASEDFERYFAAPHGCAFEHAAAQFGIGYVSPATCEEFAVEYRNALEAKRPVLIEVRTNRQENVRLHRALGESITRRITGSLSS